MHRYILCLVISFVCTINQLLHAQTPEQRPKIGLVLSGGGAKGLAHIGVIKVLEEAGIKPDYITGTSMGSIIGGLYASGYSAAELDSIVNNIDWAVVLSDQIPLSDVVPEEKADYNRFQLSFDITKKGLSLPAGMVRGHRISEMLSELTWHVSNCHSFDALPIPFRCVAVDLVEGKPYVFKEGDLSEAMRASMAIPSVFTPVEKDSMYLVDGGVLDNFPVLLCREMGADIIIGVNVGTSDKPKIDELKSITEILMTSAMIGSNIVLQESIDATDYIITPELHPYTSASFFDGTAIIERGEQAAREQIAQLQQLGDSINRYPITLQSPQNYTPEQIIVSDIKIINRKHVSQNFFFTKLGIHEGDTVSVEDINTGVRRLIGTRFYNQITYNIESNNGAYTLIFKTEETNLAQAKFSIHYDNELKAGIISNLTIRNLLFKNSRLSLTTDISEKPRAHGEMIAYLGEQQFTGFIGDGYFERTYLPIYQQNLKTAGTLNFYKAQAGAGIFLSYKTNTIVTAKLDWQEIKVSQETGLSDIFDQGVKRFGNGFIYGSFIIDRNTLNKRFFATNGHHLHFAGKANFKTYEYYDGEASSKAIIEPFIKVPQEHYLAGSLRYTKAITTSKNSTIETGLSIAAFSANAPFFDMHNIGGTAYNISTGDAAFVGLNYREKIAENYGLASIKLNFNITKVLYAHAVVNGIYAPNFGNNIFADQSFFLGPKEHIIGFGGGIAINSLIGPITLGIGTNLDDWKARAYISVGYPFM
ncbi:patatin-like phospholipase family protein [Carboxylicivirga sediminis]|uniref:Patatin-like phospholipase family protein n=1 Tax=Carboxylicivirga sediminis TaxID=2006564 RepID=A0A941F0S9_9BACT|nr:patatin-like phospholipase family protein [Carboxylicivirga sediminis]MBR8534801.1 patatin-like phospholipase family protein [Carboxylicivirga sediminis]